MGNAALSASWQPYRTWAFQHCLVGLSCLYDFLFGIRGRIKGSDSPVRKNIYLEICNTCSS